MEKVSKAIQGNTGCASKGQNQKDKLDNLWRPQPKGYEKTSSSVDRCLKTETVSPKWSHLC